MSSTKHSSSTTIPVLDFGLATKDPTVFREKLREACHRDGFFLLRNPGVPNWREQLREARTFLGRPDSDKKAISYEASPCFRGYMGLGTENTAGKVDLREQVEFANEEEGAGMTGWPPYERLRGRNPWPDGCQPSLKHTTLAYVARVVEVADVIRGALCSILRLDRGVAESLFGSDASDDDGASEGEKPHWVLKLVAYPPVDPSTILPGSFGVGPHTDTNFLTVILQDGVGGLQVHSKGQWIDVPADEEGVLVCNLGEQAEILSRGYFRATPHRVLPNTTCTTRVSVPLFYNPRLSATVAPQPLPKDLEWESDREGKDSDAGHWRMKHNVMLATVGDNTFKSLARSHPAVFRRHHGDLQQLEDGRVVRRND